jgi:hypothetical protein
MSHILHNFGPRAVAAMTIQEIYQPLEELIVWSDGFTEEEVRDIISLGEMAEFQKGVVGSDSAPTTDLDVEILIFLGLTHQNNRSGYIEDFNILCLKSITTNINLI